MRSPLNEKLDRKWIEASQRIAELEQQRDELLVALEATVEAIRLFRNEPQLERLGVGAEAGGFQFTPFTFSTVRNAPNPSKPNSRVFKSSIGNSGNAG